MRTESNVKNFYRFFDNEYIVVVEDGEDFVFWKNLFPSKINGFSLKIKTVGGKEEVKKFIEKITKDDLPYIAVVDSDYEAMLQNHYDHIRVLETLVYSIENLMICKCKASKIISDYVREDLSFHNEFELALNHYDQAVHSLMCADLFYYSQGQNLKLTNKSCVPYLKKGKFVTEFDPLTIQKRLDDCFIQDFEKIVNKYIEFKPRYYSRGHFFVSFVYKFLFSKIKAKKNNIRSIDDLTFFTLFAGSVCTNCSGDGFLKTIMEKIALSVKNVELKLSISTSTSSN